MAGALSPPVLEIHDLHVNFRTFEGSLPAVDGVDISLQKGETLGIVGETGSGKSVLLQAILRLIRLPGEITAGTIRFVGEDLIGKSDEDMRRIRGKDIARIVPTRGVTSIPFSESGTRSPMSSWHTIGLAETVPENGCASSWSPSAFRIRGCSCSPIRTS